MRQRSSIQEQLRRGNAIDTNVVVAVMIVDLLRHAPAASSEIILTSRLSWPSQPTRSRPRSIQRRSRAQGCAAGVDGVSLAAFETDLKANLYKVWNPMASGS
jgi:hypothetical protein